MAELVLALLPSSVAEVVAAPWSLASLRLLRDKLPPVRTDVCELPTAAWTASSHTAHSTPCRECLRGCMVAASGRCRRAPQPTQLREKAVSSETLQESVVELRWTAVAAAPAALLVPAETGSTGSPMCAAWMCAAGAGLSCSCIQVRAEAAVVAPFWRSEEEGGVVVVVRLWYGWAETVPPPLVQLVRCCAVSSAKPRRVRRSRALVPVSSSGRTSIAVPTPQPAVGLQPCWHRAEHPRRPRTPRLVPRRLCLRFLVVAAVVATVQQQQQQLLPPRGVEAACQRISSCSWQIAAPVTLSLGC